MYYILLFIIGISLSAFFTFFVRKAALYLNIVDAPDKERKFHHGTIPFLGGVGIFLAFFIILFFVRGNLLSGNLEIRHWLGFFLGACFLVIGGVLDDKYRLAPKYQIIFPLLASFAVIAGGVEIIKITNPLGDFLHLNTFKIPVLYFSNSWHYFVVASDTLIIVWLMGMMYTTKLLDGVDGLVSGVSAIGGLVIFLFTMTTKYYQPDIGLAALVLASVALGFLIFNWHPAKIFLGESGSLFLGYTLGVLAIISGGKIAIALLVMGIPIMDVVWIIIQRLREGKNPFKIADRKHLHFRLIDSGISIRKTVFIFYALSLSFGLSALFLQSRGKVFALGILVLIMFGLVVSSTYLGKKGRP